MIDIDLRTVFLNSVFTDFVSLVVIIVLWRQTRKRFGGLTYLVFDYIFQILCMLFIFLRGHIPDFISIDVSNTLAVSGSVMGYIGLEQFVGKKSNHFFNYIIIVLFFSVHTYFTFVNPDLSVRNLNSSVAYLIITAQCAWLLFKRVPKNLNELTFNVGVVFLLYCFISVIRIVEFFISKHSVNDYFNAGSFETFVIISYQLLFLLLTYFLVLMINKRLLIEILTQEEKFSKAFHSVPYAITITSLTDGKVIEANDGFYRITNYTVEDIKDETTLGLNLWVNPQDREWVVRNIVNDGKVKEVEFQFRKKTGELIIGQISSEILYINNEKCILSVINDITERKYAEEELKNSKELLKKFATHLQNAQEEEKILLANQLDNEIAQILVAMKMDIGLVKQKILTGTGSEQSEDLFFRLEKVQELIGNSIKNTLNMMNDLRYEVLYLMGFEEAVKLFSIEFYKKYNIICIFESNSLPFKIDQNKSTSLFRIFQIAMANVAQHADATVVHVILSYIDDKLILEINDNGKGLDQIHITNPSTNGLIFMKERALLLNGELIVTNLPNKGTSIRVEIPYSNQI